ncbi:hypothetical protein GCM10012288_12770 [Malaciobacter pacificus]|uniref:Uncharacterized protein n=1 Tax=Malaciobacter pacificus TaxID=1080223 RepID=A0A5C2H771_9BACT|nr:diguanylate cyclase [Malaciobacter pacificus]QEP34068.1 hypothetical protein APAC_0932 [Malaciobacter pacificus]GGD40180.1 hypothetical protein GCM10012288_12770 [Malaciobacter pacificus]
MKKELKKITDLTINELLNQEVILPSIYFEKFNENASKIEINIEDESFQNEINKIIIDEYNTIEEYINNIASNVTLIKDSAKEAKTALLEKNVDELSNIYKKMSNLEKEILTLNNKLFLDETTNINNRKWLYNQFLNEKGFLKEKGTSILVGIDDLEYIKKQYGELIANNLLLFTVKFIKKNLNDEKIIYNIARFFENKIIIFCKEENFDDINSIVLNLKQTLANATLKNNSGLMIKTSYSFAIEPYFENQDSKELFERLFLKLKEL